MLGVIIVYAVMCTAASAYPVLAVKRNKISYQRVVWWPLSFVGFSFVLVLIGMALLDTDNPILRTQAHTLMIMAAVGTIVALCAAIYMAPDSEVTKGHEATQRD